jgi:hypothetical protein
MAIIPQKIARVRVDKTFETWGCENLLGSRFNGLDSALNLLA